MSSVVADDTTATVSLSTPQSPPPVIDIEALLAPISEENPVGESLQYSGEYDEIREARRSEDNLEQGDWQRDAKTAEWPKVVTIASSALASKTKDIQIGGWLTEALVNLYGFVGLRDGLKLMRGLHEQYWDNLFPEIDEGDMDARANAITFMDSKIEIPLKSVPLTKSGLGTDYSYIQWEDSTKFDIPEDLDSLDSDAHARFSALKAQAEEEGKTTAEQWRKAKGASRRAFYEETFLVLNECWEEFQGLDRVMDEKFGRQTPGLGALKRTLDQVRTLVEKTVKEKRILEPDPSTDGELSADGQQQEGGASGPLGAVGPIRGRADALKRLAEVAYYFQTTEPHSPVAYLVQRAIKWGQMPLEVWLEDVIKDGTVLGHLKETLGLETAGTAESDEQNY